MSFTHWFEHRIDRFGEKCAECRDRTLFLFFFFPIASAVFLAFPLADYDLFARVAVGRLVQLYGDVVTRDPFAFTVTKPLWIDHEWFSGVVFYQVARMAGDLGLFLLKIVFAAATLFFIRSAQCHQLQSGRGLSTAATDRMRSWIFLGLAFFPMSSIWNLTVRAQIFTYLFTAFFLYVFVRYRTGQSRALLFSLPLAMIVWVNAHGGFVVGLGFIGIFFLVMLKTELFRGLRIGIAFGLCLAATLIQPYGLEFVEYILYAVTRSREFIPEWAPLNLMAPSSLLVILFLAISLLALVSRKVPLPLEGRAFLLLSAVYAISHQRFVPLFIIVSVVYASGAFVQLLETIRLRYRNRFETLRRAALLVVIGFVLYSWFSVVRGILSSGSFRLSYQYFPVGACEWLRQKPDLGGKLLTHFNDGSYALWRLYPKFQISLDGRFEEVYPDSTVDDVLKVYDPNYPDRESTLDKLSPDLILLCNQSAPGLTPKHFSPAWQVAYQDHNCSILGKRRISAEIAAGSDTPENMWSPLF